MPNWKNPCIICYKCVRRNQEYISCKNCGKLVHRKCTNLSQLDYSDKKENESYLCTFCQSNAALLNNHPAPLDPPSPSLPVDMNSSSDSINFSINDDDFDYLSDSSDENIRNLDFKSLTKTKT